jgi:hypothetical protein
MSTISQTFYVDPNAVNNASAVYINDIVLYFKAKPTATQNKSGITNPSVNISISPTKSSGASGSINFPDYDKIFVQSITNIPYSSITASTTAATQTKCTFATPVYVETGKYYSINITLQDPGYQLHVAKTSDPIVGNTTKTFSGFSAGNQGSLFDPTTNGSFQARASQQLKFAVNIAKFLASTATVQLVNKNYEFLTVANQIASFIGGEIAYAVTANSTGTLTFSTGTSTITGSGTSFLSTLQANMAIGVYVNSSLRIIRTVNAIANNISFTVTEPVPYSNGTGSNYFFPPVGKVYVTSQAANLLYLVDSNANTTLYFSNNQTVIGSDSNASANIVSINALGPSSIEPKFGITLPSGSNDTVSFALSTSNGTNYANTGGSFYANVQNFKETYTTSYTSFIASRSLEVLSSSYLTQGKSAVFNVTLNAANNGRGVYASPSIYREQLDVFAYVSAINSNDDFENTNNGRAYAKHITTKLTFDQAAYAEDLVVYATVFQPANTSVQAYAKLYNSNDPDSFDSKDWTKLSIINNNNTAISTISANNYIELNWGLPTTPPSQYQANGTVTVSTGSATIVGVGTLFNQQFANGDIVKIYQPLFPNNYQIAAVTSIANTTELTINGTTSNSSILGSGMYIDKIDTPYTAFLNPQNNGVVRYYNRNVVQYDSYDTVQIKFVLLSSSTNIVPRIHNIRVVGVST